MSMSMRAAQAIVKDCILEMSKTAPGMVEAQINASGMTLASLAAVRTAVERMIAGGYQLDRLRSTLLLCNETIRMQEEIRRLQGQQKSRLLSLMAGLNEVQ